jgi:hypothetical protein
MARQKFYVDWSDPAFPHVRPVEESWDATPLTFGDAKREIVNHFEVLRDHAKEQIAATRALRVEDAIKGDEL